jgi:hypothetical protein
MVNSEIFDWQTGRTRKEVTINELEKYIKKNVPYYFRKEKHKKKRHRQSRFFRKIVKDFMLGTVKNKTTYKTMKKESQNINAKIPLLVYPKLYHQTYLAFQCTIQSGDAFISWLEV